MSCEVPAFAANPNGSKGDFPTEILADLIESSTKISFYIPTGFTSVISAYILIIPNATGNLRWSATTTFGEVCNNEDYDTHTDNVPETTTGVTIDKLECLDISVALDALAANDVVGLEFTRHADDVLDNIGDSVHFVGVLITICS